MVTYYVLFFIHLDSRKVEIAGMTPHPNEVWRACPASSGMKQIARNVTMDEWGFLGNCRYLIPGEAGQALHDRDTKYCESFRDIIESGDVKTLRLPARSPNLNAFSERWVKSVKEECLSKLVVFGESSLRHTLREYLTHYNAERNHQGKGNILLFPNPNTRTDRCRDPTVHSREQLGGVLRYYYLEAA